jgi:hypothetical protein
VPGWRREGRRITASPALLVGGVAHARRCRKLEPSVQTGGPFSMLARFGLKILARKSCRLSLLGLKTPRHFPLCWPVRRVIDTSVSLMITFRP